MLCRVINKDKVKVLVERNELTIIDDIEKFSIGDTIPCSVAEFLLAVYEQTGIDFTNSKIVIEVVACSLQSYYIIITRIISEDQSPDDNEVDMYIFRLTEPEKLFDAVDKIKSKSFEKIKNELYEFKDRLYFCIYAKSNDYSVQDDLIPMLEETLERCRWNIVNDTILKEWGRLLSDNIIKEITAAEK